MIRRAVSSERRRESVGDADAKRLVKTTDFLKQRFGMK
jgi:hypothetical protein